MVQAVMLVIDPAKNIVIKFHQKKLMKLNQQSGTLMFQHLKLKEENG